MSRLSETRSEAIYVRMTPSEVVRLDALVEQYPSLSRSGLAREAMRLGLDVIERRGLDAIKRTSTKRGRKR